MRPLCTGRKIDFEEINSFLPGTWGDWAWNVTPNFFGGTPAPQRRRSSDVQALRKCILYVYEGGSTHEQLTAALVRGRYHVTIAHTLITALLVSCGQAFNLYIIDALFWNNRGAELCRAIRVFAPLSPVLILSHDAPEAVRQEAFDPGATYYLLGPNADKLFETVKQAMCDLMPDASEGGRGLGREVLAPPLGVDGGPEAGTSTGS